MTLAKRSSKICYRSHQPFSDFLSQLTLKSRSRVTIRDVAARAGVSHQTVSRVINGSERVNPDTRARVERAIAELHYSPNAIARFMASGRSHTLACISPNLTDYTFACIIEGAESEARRHGYYLISASAKDVPTFQSLIEELIASRRTDGLLVINPYIDDRYTFLPKSVPFVFLGAQPRRESIDFVCLDEELAGRTATQHLLNLGHQHIALITGPLEEDCSRSRQIGYQKALKLAGIDFDPALVESGDWSATSGHEAIQRLLARKKHFSAVFAQNDRMAVGAIRALREAGKEIPRDISVIGFDDMPLAAYFDPSITTLYQDMLALGEAAARLLINRIQSPDSPHQQILFNAQLIERNSTAPISADHGFRR